MFAYRLTRQGSLTPDIAQLTFAPCEDNLPFVPGQYVWVKRGNASPLALSIANAPQKNGELTFHLRHHATHPLAQDWLNDLKRQPEVLFEGPFGNCVLDRVDPTRPILFLAGGTGYAPIKALLTQAFQEKIANVLTLYWGISHPRDVYDHACLRLWQQQHLQQFGFTTVLSADLNVNQWQGKRGWVHEYAAHQHPDLSFYQVFASGPFPMVESAFNLFTEQGLPKAHFFSDILFP